MHDIIVLEDDSFAPPSFFALFHETTCLCLISQCLLYFVACNWLGCIGTAIMGSLFRSRYQQRHQLMPDNDCLCHCCCHPCALTQDSREIAIRASRGAGVSWGLTSFSQMNARMVFTLHTRISLLILLEMWVSYMVKRNKPPNCVKKGDHALVVVVFFFFSSPRYGRRLWLVCRLSKRCDRTMNGKPESRCNIHLFASFWELQRLEIKPTLPLPAVLFLMVFFLLPLAIRIGKKERIRTVQLLYRNTWALPRLRGHWQYLFFSFFPCSSTTKNNAEQND